MESSHKHVTDILLGVSSCRHSIFGLMMLLVLAHGQPMRQFPPLFNVGQGRPITSNPSGSTCGQSGRSAYCLSSVNVNSTSRCITGYCSQACPDRSGPPPDGSTFSMLIATSPGAGSCVLADTVNVRPGTPSGQFSTLINLAGPSCYLVPNASPRLDASGVVAFTITSWVWLDSTTKGTLLEKRGNNDNVLFSLQVGAVGFTFVYGSAEEDLISVSADVPIKTKQWTHVTLQVYDMSASFFVNGPGANLSAAATVRLVMAVSDSSGAFRVGQSKNGTSQFIGRIQDLKFYSLTLTNREVSEAYSGVLPSVRIQSECRCPGIYPRVKPGQTQYCIKNGDSSSISDITLRISRDAHPLEYANDGDSSTMWISDFPYEVELDIDLGDQFQVFYVVMQFYSSFPKGVTILNQKNGSSAFEVWQYYASDCARFGMDNNGGYAQPNSINCIQFGTNGPPVPYSSGNITFSTLSQFPVARPGSNDFFNTPELHDFVRARRVRVKFEDHYYVTNVRQMYFALFEFIITAWCDCNGHASQCDTSSLPYTCNCLSSSNTEGSKCERCKALFNNKPYRQGDNLQDYPCQTCTCYGHANSCAYNASLDPFPDSPDQGGGGVCVNCQHFTMGRFCDTCLPNYFRSTGVSLYDLAVCQPCDCSLAGVVAAAGVDCVKAGGQCTCKANVEGRRCDTCKAGFYGLNAANTDGCLPCSCNSVGVKAGNMSCDQTSGQCYCKANVRGLHCDSCVYGFHDLGAENELGCSSCNCNPVGSSSVYCNPIGGQCQCKEKVIGLQCDTCKDGFYNFSRGCVSCSCNTSGTESGTVCNKTSGQCTCKQNIQGVGCDQCKEGTYNFGSSPLVGCQSCTCFLAGTVNGTGSCDKATGTCLCKTNVEGQGCNRCKPNTWGLNATDPAGCQPCNCDPLGTLLENRTVCDQNTGQCSCLSNRMGRRCDSCSNGTYANPSGGCLACVCHISGTLTGTFCNATTGQCECKQGDFGIAGTNCDQCMPTFYGFSPRLGSCTPCNCLPAGSLNMTCNMATGSCYCKTFVTGRACDHCVNGSSQMDANNPFGCSSAPFQQPQPQYSNRTSTSINLVWGPPDFPNGLLSGYNIYRNSTLVGNTNASVLSYEDNGLYPFTYYNYEVEAKNAFGSVRSTAVIFQTLAGSPSNDMVLNVSDIRARSVQCTWTSPLNMNGPLLKYVLLAVRVSSNTTDQRWEGTVLTTTLTNLSPYTQYTILVQACTVGGCAAGVGVRVVTLSAPPEGQQPPVVTPLSSSELMVTWTIPTLPNGIISFYELWFRGPIGTDDNLTASIIFHPSGRYDPLAAPDGSPLSPPATSYNVTGLLAFMTYEFQVLSENEAGKAASTWAQGRTLEAAPVSIASPSVTGISSSQLLISWKTPPPADMQGSVNVYQLYQNVPQNVTQDPFAPPYSWNLVYKGNGFILNNTITGLTPYSEHSFILEACNSKGCVNSTAVTGRTLMAAPEGVQKPTAVGYNTTTMEIMWTDALFPNGPAPLYKVQKTNIALSNPASVVRGTRFPGAGYYAFPPSVLPQNVAFTGIRFRFRLGRGSGMLLFAATITQEEFIAVQFVKGRPRFMFDTQGCSSMGFATTNDEGLLYNDRKWHFFEVRRNGAYGTVVMDDQWRGDTLIKDCSNTSIIGPTTAVYVGGIPEDYVIRRTDPTRRVESTSLQGCIDGLEILQQVYPKEVWKPLNWSQGMTNDLQFLNWQGCPVNLDTGFHFMGKGYLAIANCEENICPVSGNSIHIQFRLRTELHTGMLFLLYGGTNIYMYSVLQNGTLKFVISSNTARTEVTYDDPGENFCDGNWRHLVFDKVGQQASITVTTKKTFPKGDPNLDMSLTLISDISLGGLKPGSDAMKYVLTNGLPLLIEGFGGCFSGFQINDKLYDTDMTVVYVANTNLDGCPPIYNSTSTCQSSLITQVYQGMDNLAYETGLLPYTDYIYRLLASNDVGEGVSSWSYGRTTEGAPSAMDKPTEVRALSGTMIEVTWLEPQTTFGILTKYVVNAYNAMDNTTVVSLDIPDVAVTAVNMTGVTPDTTYLVKIVACTRGGCTESHDGEEVTTPIEAPEEVPAPIAQAGPTYLLVMWQAPGKPNGPITGYFLYQDGKEIYNGGLLSFNVTGLQVYTAYNFHISACTSFGCTQGPDVSLSTFQLPPGVVGQPTLLVLDTSHIRTTWQAPTVLNGVLESYLLYCSNVSGQLGQLVYNTTDLYPEHIIEDLLAGTTYYITLGACTGGGCTLGPAANATTEESSPEGVPSPVVTAQSFSSLLVTWGSPNISNGAITQYELYQNEVLVYTGLDHTFSIGNLQPYSQHVFRVRACTAKGCASSGVVVARTLESQPEGLIVLTASVLDARTVNVTWTMPEKLNGNMTFQAYFTGLFYVSPETWNYTTILEKRALLSVVAGYTVYLVKLLVPFSNYSIQVNGSNSVGFIVSNVVNVSMPTGTPDGQAPPDLVSTPTSVTATWKPVGRVNAPEVVAYLLQFMESTPNAIVQDEFGPTITLNYTKGNLMPFTKYSFRVVARNSLGETQSPWASVVTNQDKPASMNTPIVVGVKARYADIMWSVPLSQNGIISQFNVYVNGTLRTNVTGNVTSMRVDSLLPYTYYTFTVEACTLGGCTMSQATAPIRTMEDIPEDLSLPELSAMSPSAILIKYKEPGKPNGLISLYIIERQQGSSGNVSLVTTRGPDMNKEFIDESSRLSPFSVYSYRVNVQNGAGTANGSFVQITTSASLPAGVNPPQITSVNTTSVLVNWSQPIQPNGQIEAYVIRFPLPRIEVRNTTGPLALAVSGLQSFTQYSVTVTACTSVGCTESAPTIFTTPASIASGQAAPDVTAISDSRIFALWQPPASPNGPNIKYELSRMKVYQPLDPTVGDIGVWQSLYIGLDLFYQDINLPTFTSYVYRVTVFNDIGQSTSPNSSVVTTFGGLPRLPANLTALALDHLSILVNWTIPGPIDLQGQVQNLSLLAVSSNISQTAHPDPTLSSYVMTGLTPSTLYSLTLTLTIFGGASITSQAVQAKTKDGAPSGLGPPQLSIVSDTTLRVSWTAPAQPNGEIMSYRILVNDRKIDTGARLPGSALVDGLQPFTVYDIRIEACTVFACTVSNSSLGTTTEAMPQGLAAPVAVPFSATQVNVTWGLPAFPNGVIQRYELWRKSLQSCGDLPPTVTSPDLSKCTYIECGVQENLCGSTCYSGAKVCCSGVVYDSLPGYACCDTAYLLKPAVSSICCGGQMYEPRTNYKCCGERYIEVLPGDTCCPDTNEDRLSISQGDGCCGTVPFMFSGAQMCCKGSLVNKLGSKCCGGAVTSDTSTCCGSVDQGQVYLQLPGHSCCGQDYVQTSLTLCCSTSPASFKVHVYGSELEKQTSSDKCCGLTRVTNNLVCCNYAGYNPLTQKCADRSSQDNGVCGTGVVCPISQQSTAACNRCDFNSSISSCYAIKGYQNQLPTTPGPNSTCTIETVRVYFGLDLAYIDSALSAYSQYEYSVVAVNSAGTTNSSYTAVRTLEAVPEIVLPPSTRTAPGELYAIYLAWLQPGKPNGVITSYILKREGVELYRGLDMNYTDTLNILPYQSYSYILSACNSAGCTNSSVVSFATAQAAPEDLAPPLVEAVTSTSLKVKAQPPGKPNGLILSYSIELLDRGDYYNSTVPQEFSVTNLAPFTSHTLEMVACTVVACSTSPNVTVTTLEDLPQGLAPPRIIVISATSAELHWRAPDVTNGIIRNFTLFQTRPAPVQEIYTGLNTTVTLAGLTSGQAYTYQLQASNGAGSVSSDPREIIMPTVAPINVPPPQNVRVVSSTSIWVQWTPISSAQLDIDQYRVFLNIGQDNEIERGVGLQTNVTIPDLLPYTQYEVRLQACLRNVLNGCGTSSGVVVTTKEDKPLGMAVPQLAAVASSAVSISWQPPSQPNGVILNYKIFKQQPNEPNSEILINQVPATVLSFLHSGQDLKPYTVYEYKVTAANSIGETASNWSMVRTLESPPTGLSAPTVGNVSTYGVSFLWTAPAEPNGVIREYRLVYQLDPASTSQQQFVSVPGNVTNTSVSGLGAYSAYVLYLEAFNGAGSVRSASVTFATKEGYPSGLSNFTVEKVNLGTSVILSWDAPIKPNGIITTYRVYQSNYSDAIYSSIGRNFEFRRLSPYTEYFVKLEACTRVGCTLGRMQSFYTAEVAPSTQASPTIGTVNATHVYLTWTPPLNPNGHIIFYEVLRASNALRRKREVDSFVRQFSFTDLPAQSGLFINSSDVHKLNETGLVCHREIQVAKSSQETVSEMFTSFQIIWDVPDEVFSTRNKRQATSPANIQTVYKTTDTAKSSFEFTDSDLKPYTEYQYSIRATNALGSTDSPWQSVRTEQAPPEGVQPPVLAHIDNSINSINISWTPPTQMNGVLQGYQLQRNTSIPFSFPADSSRNFVDTGLVAYTTYSYRLTACSGGGCTSSQPAIITTLEAAPLSVGVPVVTAWNSTVLRVTWSKPAISNGVITEYRLKMDGKFIYSGLLEVVMIAHLVPYEAHMFTLTACTNGGCTESAEVTNRTDDAPPTELSSPLLRVMSSKSIDVSWSPPEHPNGVILSYDVRRDGRLIYTTTLSSSGALLTSYTDYSLEPGQEYSYTVVASNRKGSVESGAAKAMTYSDSPSGLTAPILTPVSSTAIKVDWFPPINPNGVLINYTIYEGRNLVYSGPANQLSYTVPSLQFYTQYTFRVQVCTDRGCELSQPSEAWTLPALPENQTAPSLIALGNNNGAHNGVRISWDRPVKPNGDILSYELYRRDAPTAAAVAAFIAEEPILVYNGTSREFTENATQLQPFHQYQYMVIAVNPVGKVASLWADVVTKEAIPEGVLPPFVNSTTTSTITVTTIPPTKANGVIRLYSILVNGSVASSSPSQVQTVSALQPNTAYELRTQACTNVGCGNSSGVIAVTANTKPTGLADITAVVVSNTRVDLSWSAPTNPNGQDLEYQVYKRLTCPKTLQPFNQTCDLGEPSLVYSGPNMAASAMNLSSYTAYEFQLQAVNRTGGVNSTTAWVRAETMQSEPVYSQAPNTHKDGTIVTISWANSFTLNGQLKEYVLQANTKVVYRGIPSVFGVQADNQVISFIIQVVTDSGHAESPAILFDAATAASAGTLFYQEVWFIVVMCVIALILVFIVLALCIWRCGSRHAYVRERAPLHGRKQDRLTQDMHVVDSRDSSIIHEDVLPASKVRSKDNIYQGPGVGVINPAFSQDGQLARLSSPGKISWPSAKYIYDSDDDLRWGRHVDSGLFDDMDDDSNSGQTYSYTKEQTVFTDTHL